jgi:hypothetical protein
MPKTPRLSVIVINYNTPRLTSELVKSLHRFAGGIEYELIVIDNNSQPGLRYSHNPSKIQGRVLQLNHNLGFGRAVNLAAGICAAPYLLLANSDCRLTGDVISPMLDYLQSHSDVAACGPRLVFPDGRPHSSIRRLPTHANLRHSRGSVLAGSGDGYTLTVDRQRRFVEAMSATFMMVRRDFFEQVGRFDSDFFMYVEDTDLCRKFAEINKKIAFLGDLEVVHYWGASGRENRLRLKFEHHRSISRYFRRHYPNKTVANLWLDLQLAVNLIGWGLVLLIMRRER